VGGGYLKKEQWGLFSYGELGPPRLIKSARGFLEWENGTEEAEAWRRESEDEEGLERPRRLCWR